MARQYAVYGVPPSIRFSRGVATNDSLDGTRQIAASGNQDGAPFSQADVDALNAAHATWLTEDEAQDLAKGLDWTPPLRPDWRTAGA